MARPIKSGIEYFPLDVSLDEKWELIEAEFGLVGFAVVVKLFQRIYGRGYYCEWTTEVALLFGKSVGLGGTAVSEIVSASIKRGIFSQDLYDKYGILTSTGIQKRYFEATGRRKEIEVDNRYLLVNPAHYVKNAHINAINVDINSKNADRNEQSREEKRRVEKSRTGDTRAKRFTPPTLEEAEAYRQERGSRVVPQEFIDFYAAKNWMIGKTRMADWKAAFRNAEKWERWDKMPKSTQSSNAVAPTAVQGKGELERMKKILEAVKGVGS